MVPHAEKLGAESNTKKMVEKELLTKKFELIEVEAEDLENP